MLLVEVMYLLRKESSLLFYLKYKHTVNKISSSTAQKAFFFFLIQKVIICNELCNNTPTNVLVQWPGIITSWKETPASTQSLAALEEDANKRSGL